MQEGSLLDVFNTSTSQHDSPQSIVCNEVKRRGCVIDLERTPQLEMRPGDELIAYIKVSSSGQLGC